MMQGKKKKKRKKHKDHRIENLKDLQQDAKQILDHLLSQ